VPRTAFASVRSNWLSLTIESNIPDRPHVLQDMLYQRLSLGMYTSWRRQETQLTYPMRTGARSRSSKTTTGSASTLSRTPSTSTSRPKSSKVAERHGSLALSSILGVSYIATLETLPMPAMERTLTEKDRLPYTSFRSRLERGSMIREEGVQGVQGVFKCSKSTSALQHLHVEQSLTQSVRQKMKTSSWETRL
jgi:hypothetical protein